MVVKAGRQQQSSAQQPHSTLHSSTMLCSNGDSLLQTAGGAAAGRPDGGEGVSSSLQQQERRAITRLTVSPSKHKRKNRVRVRSIQRFHETGGRPVDASCQVNSQRPTNRLAEPCRSNASYSNTATAPNVASSPDTSQCRSDLLKIGRISRTFIPR